MEKEVKFMETKKATIENRKEDKVYLVLVVGTGVVKIELTADNPNNVKTAFDEILKELKNGLFEFKLEDETQDLFHHICEEYIKQLNSEIKSIFNELVEYGLAEKPESSSKTESEKIDKPAMASKPKSESE